MPVNGSDEGLIHVEMQYRPSIGILALALRRDHGQAFGGDPQVQLARDQFDVWLFVLRDISLNKRIGAVQAAHRA